MRQNEKKEFAELNKHLLYIIENGAAAPLDAVKVARCAYNHSQRLFSRLDQTHMNYTNQETAFTDIFINNNQWALDHTRKMLAEVKAAENDSDGVFTREQFELHRFSDVLKNWFGDMQEAMIHRASNGLGDDEKPHRAQLKDIAVGFRDIGSLHRVEWSEVAQSQMSE